MTPSREADPAIRLVTEIPGPRSREIGDRHSAALTRGAGRLTPIAVASAHGVRVTDVDGNRFIDLAGGIGVLALGHTPETVCAAMTKQTADLIHMCAVVSTYEPFVLLAERLNEITPGNFPKKTVLLNTGAEAVEVAVGLCRWFTRRQAVVAFEGAYHGRTNLAMAMTSKFTQFKPGFGPFTPEVYRFPFPDVYHRPAAMTADEFVAWQVAHLDHCFAAIVHPSHVACVVVEPLQGEGGFNPAPIPWLRRLRELCDEHGMVLVADEVQSGFGRTGELFAIEHAGVVPDVVTTAKSLASGMPLSAVTGRAEIIDAPQPGSVGGTYSGNPLACVAALAALDAITAPAFLERARAVGARIREHLEAIRADHPTLIGDLRGLGAMLAIEFSRDGDPHRPWPEACDAVAAENLQRGVITIRAGMDANCLRFLPPLIISDDEIDEAFAVVADSIASVAARADDL
jgi:4-aminobutyrate aminotransferase/(S)-3-amino-2-methylpropionate transaminase